MSQSVWGRKGSGEGGRVSSLRVFFKYQFKLHCIHWEVLEIMGILDCGQKVLEVMGAPECGQRLGHPGIEMTQSQRAF